MAKGNKHTLDTMSITVLLIMAVFGGIIGFYVGKSSVISQLSGFRDVTTMMDTMGKMMEQRGTRYGDRELKDSGKLMMEKGAMVTTSMDMMMKGY